MNNSLATSYPFIKQIVIEEGYQNEIEWQKNINFDDIDRKYLIREIAWVILSSGMKEAIIKKIFSKISTLFNNWDGPEKIIENKNYYYNKGLKIFNNPKKIKAILDSMELVLQYDISNLKEKIRKSPNDVLQSFPFIGPVTCYHLAKNIGLPVAKPDRHLVRIAQLVGYDSVQMFCEDISNVCGDSVPVVDIVFWRFATIEPEYLRVLHSLSAG